jgi:signal peptidase II
VADADVYPLESMGHDRGVSDDRPIDRNSPESQNTPDVATPDNDTTNSIVERPAAASEEVKRLRTRLLLLIAFVILALDLVTKIAVVHWIQPGRPIEIIGDVVTLRLVRNPGAAFSMATGMTWLLTIVAVCVVIGVIRIGRTLRSPLWALGLGLVLGGALGNLIDRFFRAPGPLQGHVVDFVSVGWWPVFNVADSAVSIGAVALVVYSLRAPQD